jgi:ATP-dependent helicase/nuclease subunit B
MHVFTIPASAPFLRTLVDALLDGRLVEGYAPRHAPELLADATLYLATRRAVRSVREIFLEALGTDAVILPRIVALGDTDEEELSFAQAALPEGFPDLDIPPALDGLTRRLQLSVLIAAWARQIRPADRLQSPLVVAGPASALALADDLARLMDDMATRGVDYRALDKLVPDGFDRYWQLTLDFLKIAAEAWPQRLAELGCIEPAQRRDLMIAAEAARLAGQARGPVIAAGSTGSMPATAKLLRAIASLPHGAVVLPGLDTDLDDGAWQAIGGRRGGQLADTPASNHPQYALHGLLERFGIDREAVATLGEPMAPGRELLLSEVMRPSGETAQWQARLAEPAVAAAIDAAMQGIRVVTAPTSEMEALAIAVAMREAHEHDESCALVTPDRGLARRVIAALGRWNVPVDDSGGDALTETPAGIFARLAAQCAASGIEPPILLALLKHPLLRLGREPGGWRAATQTLEVAALRGPRPASGCAALAHELELVRQQRGGLHYSDPRRALTDAQLDDAAQLATALAAALAPLTECDGRTGEDVVSLAARHASVLMALATDHDGEAPLFEGAAGIALRDALDEACAVDSNGRLAATLSEYAELFATAFSDRAVRRPQIAEARLRIFGPLEARLTDSERVIIGGLVEGIWPPAPRIDPWLSRPMRHELGLDLPERRIGLSAHDFAQLFGAREVILTHAAKSGGSPAVASRFLHRLEAVAGRQRWQSALLRGRCYLDWAQTLDRPDAVTPCPQPQPRPPRVARPTKLSVTAIEHWLRDPYTIYARYILKLMPLQPVDMPPSAADRGSAIHDAIGEFTKATAQGLPKDAERLLLQFGEQAFAQLMERPEARALWWPRFRRIAGWVASWESDRRTNVKSVAAEKKGSLAIPLDDGRSFTLTARADRIEHRRDGTFALLDYKTGMPPSDKQVRLGLSPQLTLEAAILNAGGFEEIPAGSVSELAYVRVSGNNPPGKECVLALKLGKDDVLMPDEAAAEARMKLEAHVRRFDSDSEPYRSLVLPQWKDRYGDYDDLARIKEWSIVADAESEP